MNRKNLNVRLTSRTIASGVAIMLAMTAMAQDSPRLRTPRKAAQGISQRINPADIFDAEYRREPQHGTGPRTGTDWPGAGLQPVSGSAIGWCVGQSFVFRAVAVDDQPEPGGSGSIAQDRSS